ncbi:hypothetical protein LK09_14690 [Microbacterium mangrovi]|uniref:Uncharacterized protein n=1 Tax=Microbacterium mangrovi TaxID=1348253 RepID=A0A0B2A4Q7_9MICO|nr:hypothetical protein [Microbacterium mangrovi]KHK96582.1 hypothetical protein LK09_14690 [Microbacterium mangrovi]
MALDPPITLSGKVFKYWVMDRTAGTATVYLQDGQTISGPIEVSDLIASEVARTIFDWEKWTTINITKTGDVVFAQTYSPVERNPLRGRITVYLDQNHWSSLAAARTGSHRIRSESERAAALRVAELASDAGIVLPVSSATVRETGAMYGNRRYALGISIAQLAGGWQLRHPLAVARHEILIAVAGLMDAKQPPPRAGVTLEPYAWMDDPREVAATEPDSSELFILAMGCPTVILEMLTDPDPTPDPIATNWARKHTGLQRQLANIADKTARRRAAYAAALEDHSEAISLALAALGQPTASLDLPAADVPYFFAKMPMLGIFVELYVRRLTDSGWTWRENDLTDMFFLSSGAAYADYVVAERATGAQMKQVLAKLGRDDNVVVTLEDLVARLEEQGVRTATEREESR